MGDGHLLAPLFARQLTPEGFFGRDVDPLATVWSVEKSSTTIATDAAATAQPSRTEALTEVTVMIITIRLGFIRGGR